MACCALLTGPTARAAAALDAIADWGEGIMQTSAAPLPDNAAHVLVVDDDRRIRDLLSRYLQREGYRVTTANNASEARAKLDGLAFDLLILVMMPGETGFELAKSVRQNSQVPIL